VVLHAEDNEMSRNSKSHQKGRFEMIWARHLKLIAKVGVAALALGALATNGNAQNIYQGKFTLPFETHWGSATLPAGDYTFVMSSAISDYRLYIRGEKVNAIVMAAAADEKAGSGHAQLNLVDIADTQTVQTFDAPELGKTFVYSTPTQKHMGRKEAHQKTAPQTAPATQSSENRTSIAIQAAGR
jgi:hypothetical protein